MDLNHNPAAIGQFADSFDLDADDAAIFQNCGGFCALPTPAGVPVKMISPGIQREGAREMGDQEAHAEYHVGGRAVLLLDAINRRHDAQILRVGDLIGGDDDGTERTEGIESLRPRPLFVARLQVARRDIVGDCVAEDVIQRLRFRDLARRFGR